MDARTLRRTAAQIVPWWKVFREPGFIARRSLAKQVERLAKAAGEADPDLLMRDLARVLRPGGLLVLTAPLVWEEHEVPYDFHRFTSFGLRRCVEMAGLEVRDLRPTTGAPQTIAQLNSVYLHRWIGGNIPLWSSLVTAVICAPVQLFGMLLGSVAPGPGTLYLDNAVLAVKPAEEAS